MRQRKHWDQKSRRKLPWTPEDTVELLSHLDFVVNDLGPKVTPDRQANVLRKLQCSLGNRTQRDIHSKLFRLWRENAKESQKWAFENVFYVGTSCMNKLDDSIRLKIQGALEVIRNNKLFEQVSTPRKLRGAVRNVSVDADFAQPHQSRSRDRTPIRRVTPHRQSNLAQSKPLANEVRDNLNFWTEFL